MPTPRVIDLSHYQVIPEDLLETKEAGIIGVIHKLTEGSSIIDEKAQARHYLATQAGLAWGIYHFLRPGDMEAQAKFFINTAYDLGVIDNDTVLVADHEDESVSGEELKQFLDIVEELMQRSPVVYSGHVLKEQLEGSGYHVKRRLWLCQYADKPVLPEGVTEYWMWQYTDSGEIAGVVPPVDLNDIGDVPVDEFLRGWSGSYLEPEPVPPEPEPEYGEVVMSITSQQPIKLTIAASPNVTIVVDEVE